MDKFLNIKTSKNQKKINNNDILSIHKSIDPKTGIPSLAQIQDFINVINNTNSKNEKKEILTNYSFMKIILRYIYDDLYVFNVTSKNYLKYEKSSKKIKKQIDGFVMNIIHLLDILKDSVSGDTALNYIYCYVRENNEHKDLILKIIDKNIKIGINKTEINKVFPDLIPCFNVVLANKYENKHIKNGDEWYISRKLDGVRCICVIEPKKNKVMFYSRTGKEIHTLDILSNYIKEHLSIFGHNSLILDGEIVDYDEKTDKEDFKGIMEKIRRKDFIIENPRYYVFDILEYSDFFSRKSKFIFSERQHRLYNLINILNEISTNSYIIHLDQEKFSEETFERMKKVSLDNEWEGLMLRKDTIYEGKRTNNLLKYKLMSDDEYKVIGIESGIFPIKNEHTGLIENKEMMSNIIIDYDGNNVGVGSGFNLVERIFYYENPDEIMNKIVTIQYFEKTDVSLRFPIFKGIQGVERIY